MNPEELNFEDFFAERMRQKGASVKKLADMTGIIPRHLAEIAAGNFSALPSAPYVRGYLIRLGEALDFDGEAWWQKIKTERRVKNSGATDALPENRFIKKYPTKYIGGGIIVLLVVIYAVIQFPNIIGKPSITINEPDPSQNPFVTNMYQFPIQGNVQNASALSIDGDTITISPTGSWQKEVTLSNGMNQFTITAKKFLGGTTEVTERIVYQPLPESQTTSTGQTQMSSEPSTTAQ